MNLTYLTCIKWKQKPKKACEIHSGRRYPYLSLLLHGGEAGEKSEASANNTKMPRTKGEKKTHPDEEFYEYLYTQDAIMEEVPTLY